MIPFQIFKAFGSKDWKKWSQTDKNTANFAQELEKNANFVTKLLNNHKFHQKISKALQVLSKDQKKNADFVKRL